MGFSKTFAEIVRWGRLGLLASAITACGGPEAGAFLDHDEEADFEPFDSAKADGVSSTFDRNNVVDDAFFTSSGAIDAATVQAFLEHTPYDKRCFLADEVIGGTTPAQAIVDAAVEHGINPIMLLSRMQVEKGLVSKSKRPSQSSIDFAFGCGCSDGKSCSSAFKGFDKQIDCAAETMRKHFDTAAAGNGIWNVGVPKKSLDGLTVTPANAATASLYAYTPWVLPGDGGNWLVWNVTGKFVNHLEAGGAIDIEEPEFIGSPCETTDAEACGFSNAGDQGFCLATGGDGDSAGVCTIDCEGLCPDRAGTVGADTMCVEIEPGSGGCMPVAGSHNADCADIPGTAPKPMERFVGSSGASVRMATVCMPTGVSSPDGGGDGGGGDGGPSCVGACGDTSAQPDGLGNACFCDDQCVANGDCCGDFHDVCGG